jgi:predicted nuclease of restriction endonuclease-like (RecB) superfamily
VVGVARKKSGIVRPELGYDAVLSEVVGLIEAARRASTRAVNALMTATYWGIGRRIVEQEQHGAARAGYGEELIVRLSGDLQARFGRGFGRANLFQMRAFYLEYREILQTLSGESASAGALQKVQTASGQSWGHEGLAAVAGRFPLPWSHYVRLLSVRNIEARRFYEAEALRGGWTIRQLDRQIGTQFYERTALSRNKAAMLQRAEATKPGDVVTPEEEIKEPYFLEFLDLKDEYSETDLEAALIAKIEAFLLELGGDFTFVGRQRRLRVGDAWYRIDLLFFHRRLRCLVIIDLLCGRAHKRSSVAERVMWRLPGRGGGEPGSGTRIRNITGAYRSRRNAIKLRSSRHVGSRLLPHSVSTFASAFAFISRSASA